MAMTKKEREQMAALEGERGLALALRFRSEPIPKPMEPAEDYAELRQGWGENAYGEKVFPGCFTRHNHADGLTHKTTSQGSGEFYATRFEALLVMRNKVARDAASRLARIDAMIEQERDNPTPIPDTTPIKAKGM